MELGRSAWIRRERLARIATAERDRRAGRTALAIAALGEASEWPARAVLALALLPESEGSHARRILEEGLDIWAMEAGMPPLDALGALALDGTDEPAVDSPPVPAFEAFQIELDRPIEAGELEQAFAEAEAQVDEMHDVNRVAERVLFDGAFELADLAGEELDPLEESARLAAVDRARAPTDAASVPGMDSVRSHSAPRSLAAERWDVDATSGRPSREIVLATLERWLQNLSQSGAEETMTFESILQRIVDDCGGGFSAALMGLDGIAVAQVTAQGGRDREDPLGGDATFAGIEFGRILGDMTKASDALDAGPLRESVISLARVQLVFHTVDDDLVLVLALHPDGNLGKARYLIRRNLPAIRAAL